MAYGQQQKVIAFPQPGTSNLPIAVKIRVSGGFLGLFPKYTWLPPFVPVNYTNTPDIATVISNLSLVLEALKNSVNLQIGIPGAPVPGTIIADLQEINSNLARIADQRAAWASSLQKLSVAVGSRTTALNVNTQILTSKAANKIQFDNFFKAYNGEKPDLPSIQKQFELSAKEAIAFNDQVRKVSFINNTVNDVVSATTNWISGTKVYQTIDKYITEVKDKILAVLPDSLKTTASKLKTGKASP